jgi:hypothetical protein
MKVGAEIRRRKEIQESTTMRTNLPVTNNEVQLSDTTLIVSKTDLKGRITYINRISSIFPASPRPS